MVSRTVAGVLVGLLLPATVVAAPFCLTSEALTPICIYYDANSCQQEANRQGATCSVNSAELHLATNVGQFCLVTSAGASECIYSDRITCANDAVRQHGVCANAPEVAPSAAPDPFAPVGGD
jgi:hypothetical protein